MRLFLSACAFAALFAAPIVHAVEITQTFDINAVGFDSSAPVDPVILSFTVQYDNSASFGPTTSGLTIDSFNLPYSSAYEYDASFDILTIATAPLANSNFALYAAYADIPNGYGSFIGGASTSTPYSYGFFYETDDSVGHYASNTTVTDTPGVAPVPEPSTWAMMLGGLAMLGFMLRRSGQATSLTA